MPCIWFFFPETAGRSLEEIDEIFALSQSIWDPVKVARRLPKKHLAELVEEQEGGEKARAVGMGVPEEREKTGMEGAEHRENVNGAV